MRALIVNADDFGMSAAVNRGIALAHRSGIVTSASLMANGAAFAEAVALARELPGLGIGVHLNVVEGRPVADPERVRTLLGRDGAFPMGAWKLAARSWLRRVDPDELVVEFSAQIAAVVSAGIVPTHVDSHMHAHALPKVMAAALTAAARYGIGRIRCSDERRWPREGPVALRARAAAVRWLARRSRGSIARAGVYTPDHFIGPSLMGRLDAPRLVAVLERLPAGVTELMCHPADGTGHNDLLQRDCELAALTAPSVRQTVASAGLRLQSFAGLAAPNEQLG